MRISVESELGSCHIPDVLMLEYKILKGILSRLQISMHDRKNIFLKLPVLIFWFITIYVLINVKTKVMAKMLFPHLKYCLTIALNSVVGKGPGGLK